MTEQTSSSPANAQSGLAGAPGPGGIRTVDLTQIEDIDADGSSGTSYGLEIGGRFGGTIGPAGDSDWIAVELEAGQSYRFVMYGTGGFPTGIEDTILRLMDDNGQTVALNDDLWVDEQNNGFSGIRFTATESGTYFLNAAGVGTDAGDYVVQAALDVHTVDQVVTLLTDAYWGAPTAVAHDVGADGALTVNMAGLSADGAALAQAALDLWTAYVGIEFSLTTEAGAEIVMDDSSLGAFGGPQSFFPDTGSIDLGLVNVGQDWLDAYGTTLDSYSFFTYLHEIAHALGLGHAGPYDVTASYAQDAFFANDSWQMTIMSYFGAADNTTIGGTDWIPITPMIADVAAMWALYGPPDAVEAGNTVWGVGSNIDGTLGRILRYAFGSATNAAEWDGSAMARDIGFTIVDTGGIDLFDASNFGGAQMVDLRDGAASNVLGEIGNVVIMRGSVIENARTGAGDDRLTGNDADNRLTGGRGNDTINGGLGNDTAMIAATRASAEVTFGEDGTITVVSADGTDILTGIEFIAFSDQTVSTTVFLPTDDILGSEGSDPLRGSADGDTVRGFGGDDTITAGNGNDIVYGGTGDDLMGGETGDDELYGDEGDDRISASDGNDTVYGGDGNDSMGGGLGDDEVYGSQGNDTVGSGFGNDTVEGGEGNDLLSGGAGNDTLDGGNGDDRGAGSFGNDTFLCGAGNDNVGGGNGNDSIFGGDGNDTVGAGAQNDSVLGDAGDDLLGGGDGNDSLFGGDGRDQLNGGRGNDLLDGGEGVDTFLFHLGSIPDGGTDTIAKFQNGTDFIRIIGVPGGSNAARFDALDITSEAGDTVIRYGQQTIILDNTAIGLVDVTDFLFA
jgi:serralysin